MNELIGILEREAAALEMVLYRLKSLRLLLAAGQERFLSEASDELDAAAEHLGALDAIRAVLVTDIAREYGIEEEQATLGRLIDLAGDPGRGQLVALQRRLQGLAEEVERETGAGRDLALHKVAELRKVMERLSGLPAARYGLDGLPESLRRGRIDRLL